MDYVYYFIDVNGTHLMGSASDSFREHLTEIKNPLLVKYTNNKDLNCISSLFSPYDFVNNPRKIQSRIATAYRPDYEQVKLYNEAVLKFFKGYDNE